MDNSFDGSAPTSLSAMRGPSTRALVVLSGGQDSATCAAWARVNFDSLDFISFDYGQRHRRELQSAARIAGLLCDRDRSPPECFHVVKMPILEGNPASGLTNPDLSVNKVGNDGLPSSFLPGRNLVFLTAAASFAASRGIRHVVTGVCQTDYSGYPDCREQALMWLEVAINEGLGGNAVRRDRIMLHMPLMHLTKAQTVRLAQRLPLGMTAVEMSWTCYEGGEYACGTCPACMLRSKGFAEAGVSDPAQKSPQAMIRAANDELARHPCPKCRTHYNEV